MAVKFPEPDILGVEVLRYAHAQLHALMSCVQSVCMPGGGATFLFNLKCSLSFPLSHPELGIFLYTCGGVLLVLSGDCHAGLCILYGDC